jgi:lysophospholipase L1-like esterase
MPYSMNNNDMRKPSLLFSLCVLTSVAFSQNEIQFAIANDSSLVNYDQTKISNAQSLYPFFEKLYQLKKAKNTAVNILHIGDSHIQADYQTHQVRQNFQREFGNAGRGLLVPLRVAQTNEPWTYTSQSETKWESKRIVFPDQPLPIGLGGVTVRSNEVGALLKIKTKNYPGLNYEFNKVTAIFQKENRSYHIALQDSLGRNLAFIGDFSPSDNKNSATIMLANPGNALSFKSVKSLDYQDRVTYYGFNFENSNPGILYHSIGVNGAKYKHYASAPAFGEQTSILKPDLIVLALGTNEALDHPYSDPKFLEYVDGLIKQLKTHNPSAVILISIHPDSFRRKNKRNPGVLAVREKLIEYADREKITYFDLFEAGGGKEFAEQWRDKELLRPDGVHFTRAGYELQGNMFYLALIKAYNLYVSDKR